MAIDSTAREEILQPNIPTEVTLAETLAHLYQNASTEQKGYPLLDDLSAYENWIDQAYQFFRNETKHESTLTYASEWILDNYYIVQQAIEEIEEDLPPGYYQKLPKLTNGPFQGYPRIYAIIQYILSIQNLLIRFNDLENLLATLQNHVALTMGELWAAPIFLRYGVVEALAYALDEVIRPASRPELPRLRVQVFGDESSAPDPSALVANAIISLRAISNHNWRDFFENVSLAEQILREDPAGVYAAMDFNTRDSYRKQIEHLALSTKRDEVTLTRLVVELAQESSRQNGGKDLTFERQAHVGYYLIDEGRAALERHIQFRPQGGEAIRRWVTGNGEGVYLGGITTFSLILLLLLSAVLYPRLVTSADPYALLKFLVLLLLSVIPAVTIANEVINWLITLSFAPHVLPKLSFKDQIPDEYHTLVVIPALITTEEDIDDLAKQLQLHYLRNPETGLSFALLTDFADADQETLANDAQLVQYGLSAIQQLNQAHPNPTGGQRFYFFHRRRLYNPKEDRWMGWERKRGKLHELNQRLLGGEPQNSLFSFLQLEDGFEQLPPVRFIITLDSDTILPSGAAKRLVGTLAHPLNRAIFDPQTGQVTAGYTLLQPRVEISPSSANRSWFTRIFAGDSGLDLYSRAVSDVYQDLFHEGIYVGKGIYDLAALEHSVDGHIPENTLLSHDLLEGLLGRAGLASDITLIEDYPPNYLVQIKRQQRWIRGDWQLLRWLLWPKKYGVQFSTLDRWKIIDNLRRSLLATDVLLLFLLGLLLAPTLSLLWTAIVLLTFNVPLLTSLVMTIRKAAAGEPQSGVLQAAALALLRGLLAVSFLPFEAFNILKTILRTLYRLFISRKNLLQWTTAAKTVQIFGSTANRFTIWLQMVPVMLLSLVVVVWLSINAPASLPGAALILLLWAVSPAIASWIPRPIHKPVKTDLNEDELGLLRRVARRTWAFFEQFVGPEDHWLPPDNYQESPVGVVAHRTSPTNIGLLLNSTLAAYDFGYIEPIGLVTRLTATFDTLERLERYRGHFLNWFDTVTLQPLTPRYVSTVDSGNLAASLIVTARACQSLPGNPIFRKELWQGYLDTLANLHATLTRVESSPNTRPLGTVEAQKEITQQIDEMCELIVAAQNQPSLWYGLFKRASGPFWQGLSTQLGKLVSAKPPLFEMEDLHSLQQVAEQIERQHISIQRVLDELVPWVPLLASIPPLLQQDIYAETLLKLRAALPNNPSIQGIRHAAHQVAEHIGQLRSQLSAQASTDPAVQEGISWVDALEQAVMRGQGTAGVLMNGFQMLVMQAEKYIREMDFSFLYHSQRRIFHIGYNLDSGLLDNNFYDLLASEARIASLIAIAKADVPTEHWLHIGRPITKVQGLRVLLSWSATMFEYLMPSLFLRTYPGTLLAESAHGAVAHQIAYGKSKDVPWGISESGFYRFDASHTYQYRAFGVPGLGFKRGLSDDLVIAPYASLMAVKHQPQAVVQNILQLIQHKMLGRFGFYEAIDFTPERLIVGKTAARVQEYMAHHQGMVMVALANYFHDDIMVERMHADPRIKSIELLLQEQVPLTVPLRNPHSEDVKGVQRTVQAVEKVAPWTVPVQTPIPQLHLLSNGTYNVLISNTGSGVSSWNGIDLTRWQPDGVLDNRGVWLYLQELYPDNAGDEKLGELWSAGYQPIPGSTSNAQITFFPHMVVLRRSERRINNTVEITISPDAPVEIRRVHLYNDSDTQRSIRLTSYGEVILNQQAGDARHPAFNKLFIESEYVPELNLQIFKRRPRSEKESPVFMGHMLVLPEGSSPDGMHESDRYRFLGRYGTIHRPQALINEQYLSGTSGATLDPIFALGQTIALKEHENAILAYLTFAADSREEIVNLATQYSSWTVIERTYQQADIAAQSWLGQQNYQTQSLQDALQALSALLYVNKHTRAAPEILASNTLGQPALWRFGVSGDYPILLVEINDADQLDLVHDALQIHRFFRSRRFLVDVVIVNRQQTNYGAELNSMLYRLVSRSNSEQWLNQRGGVFILYHDQMQPEEYTLMLAAARLVISGERGTLHDQLPGYSIPVPHLPDFQPTRQAEIAPIILGSNGRAGDIQPRQFDNSHGGFSADGREYCIDVTPGKPTPAPWTNVVGYPEFGFLVTEAGSQCTWAFNSGENRLTPWSNDPVSDPSGEVLYLRDEETGEVWTPTPLPAGKDAAFQVRHGKGYSVFEHTSHGLHHCLTLFASPTEPVKIIQLHIHNPSDQPRRITATQYVEWVLGTTQAINRPFILSDYDADNACLLVNNPYNTEFQGRVAFLASNKPVRGITADRAEFLGRAGSYSAPAALSRLGLETRISHGEDPCGVLQVQIEIAPQTTEEVIFLLGQSTSRAGGLAIVEKYRQPEAASAVLAETHAFWDRLLNTVQVNTPNAAMNLMLNSWLLYQAVSCRLWGRSAFYQSSGAFGFRDQLQDVLALCTIAPELAREQIRNAARHQFTEGDVLHWWHPPSGRGVRTRFSDDLLWLPYVTAIYVETTGDVGILDENEPFRTGPLLKEGEDERYGEYPLIEQSFPIIEHCLRAIAKGSTSGPHGLPLMGTGDWNDGMNRVGEEGCGESVWLAWFLIDVLNRFAAVLDNYQAGGTGELRKLAEDYRSRANAYAQRIEEAAWDGDWYRRAYYDNGDPLGSAQNEECQIDAIAQSWAVLSKAGQPQRARQAIQSVLNRLVRPDDRLILLFTPPFDNTPQNPGYIKGYLPGIRENGGQYTHAAIWTVWSVAALGLGQEAVTLYDLLNPIYQADSAEKAAVYRVEPYVICADIYSVEPYVRRGGWTWYTGSASWMYRLGVEGLLGIQRRGQKLVIQPNISPQWDGFTAAYRFGSSVYRIEVRNPEHVSHGVREVMVDGKHLPAPHAIDVVDDQSEHNVLIILGSLSH